MNTIYIVTSGFRDDLEVSNVFTTRELAQKFIDSFGNKYVDFKISEFVLNPYKEELEAGKSPYRAIMRRDGEMSDCDIYAYEPHYSNANFKKCVKKVRAGLFFEGWAANEEEVANILDKERLRLISEGLWDKAQQDKIDAELEAEEDKRKEIALLWKDNIGIEQVTRNVLVEMLSSATNPDLNPDGTRTWKGSYLKDDEPKNEKL